MKYVKQISLMLAACGLLACTPVETVNAVTDEQPTPTPSASIEVTGTADHTAEIAAFRKEFETRGKTYQGALQMMFKALLAIEEDIQKGEHLLALTLNGKHMYASDASPTGYDVGNSIRFLLQQIESKPNTVLSYIGGTPERAYADADRQNLPMTWAKQGEVVSGVRINNTLEEPDATQGQIYFLSSGKDLPSIAYLEKNPSGLWKIDPRTVSNIATGVKAPAPSDF